MTGMACLLPSMVVSGEQNRLLQKPGAAAVQNIGLIGGVLYFMATSDGVPLKVKRKPHQE